MYRGLRVPVTGQHVIKGIVDQLLDGDYESPETDAIMALLKPDDTVLELGVGIGVVSALAAQAAPQARIECFEANPNLIEPIRDLHEANGITNVTVNNAVLVPGPGGGTRRFHLHPSFASGSLVETSESSGSTDVPAIGFAETVEKLCPNFLIMDIEGGEAEILTGADLSGFRVLVLELHPDVLTRPEVKGIFDACIGSGLYPRVELSRGQVVAFERVSEPV